MLRIKWLLSGLLYAALLATPVVADDDVADRTAAAHAHDKPVATPAATTAPARPVDSREVIYTSANGESVTGWLSWPADSVPGDLPGLIVIHEWWGLNDNIRQKSERLAGEGYVTLAVDLYSGALAKVPKEAMQLMQVLNNDAAAGGDNLAAAYDYLANVVQADKIGVVGWCLGGQWSLRASLRMPDSLDATVIYYGNVTDDKDELATLQMPILGLFAAKDPVVPLPSVLAFRDALTELGKPADIQIYPDAQHGFANPSGMAYDPEAAADAWQRTTAFLARHLQVSTE